MYKRYKNKEKRRLWLKNYRIKNRKRLYKMHREWRLRVCPRYNYYQAKGKKIEGYYGTTGVGRKYEKIALKLLNNSIDRNINSLRGKWDIEWNGLKIDVKMRNKRKDNCYGFNLKKNPVADYYLLFLVDNERIKKILFVPRKIFKNQSLTISDRNNKYNKYLLKFYLFRN